MVPLIQQQLGARVRAAHRGLSAHAFYPLVLSTALAIAVIAARIWATHSMQFAFLAWNLVLAWIPYVLSLATVTLAPRVGRPVLLVPLFAAWLLFFPNAFYVVTDLVHLAPRPRVPYWYDIGLLATTAWTGCFLASTSLRAMHDVVHARLGWAAGWLFALACLWLGALGIYVGRFWRWNSWDMILRPSSRVTELASLFVHPRANLGVWAFIALFSAFSFVCYLAFRGHRGAGSAPTGRALTPGPSPGGRGET